MPNIIQDFITLLHSFYAACDARWEEARDGILALPNDAFETAGGNGHSRTSMLWFVANRPLHRSKADLASMRSDESTAPPVGLGAESGKH